MFRILGKDALYIDLPVVFKSQMLGLCTDDEKEATFKEILEKSEIEYLLNGSTEEHTFFIRVPTEITPEQIQTMADSVLQILGRVVENTPLIDVDGVRQKYQVIVTNWEEPEIIGLNKTPGMSSGAVFMPIINSLSKAGRENMNEDRNQFF